MKSLYTTSFYSASTNKCLIKTALKQEASEYDCEAHVEDSPQKFNTKLQVYKGRLQLGCWTTKLITEY